MEDKLYNILREFGVNALEDWCPKHIGMKHRYTIKKDNEERYIQITTSQKHKLKYEKKDGKWISLSDVDFIIAVTVDNTKKPKNAIVYMIDACKIEALADSKCEDKEVGNFSIKMEIPKNLEDPMYLEDIAYTPLTYTSLKDLLY